LLELFRPAHLTPEAFFGISEMGIRLLRFVAAYLFFDALYMICIGVLKGAGDTRFIMWSIGTLSLGVMILPIYIGVEVFKAGIYFAWSCATCFIFLLFAVSFWRYQQGRWKKVRILRTPAQTREGESLSDFR
jgi:MATE family multidrug resistance protein